MTINNYAKDKTSLGKTSSNLSLKSRPLNNEKDTFNRENKLSSLAILHKVKDL